MWLISVTFLCFLNYPLSIWNIQEPIDDWLGHPVQLWGGTLWGGNYLPLIGLHHNDNRLSPLASPAAVLASEPGIISAVGPHNSSSWNILWCILFCWSCKWHISSIHSNYFFFQVLVPCKGSLTSNVQSTCQFESYILKPVEEHFQTLNGKVFISLWVNQGYSLSVWVGWRGENPACPPFTSMLNDGLITSVLWYGVGGSAAFEERGGGRAQHGLGWASLPQPVGFLPVISLP